MSATFERAAPLFAALGDQTRIKLIARLCAEGPLSTLRLGAVAEVSRQGLTKHLQALEQAGLVRSERQGRDRVWMVRTARLGEVQGYLEQISRQWEGAIDRLRALVEEGEG